MRLKDLMGAGLGGDDEAEPESDGDYGDDDDAAAAELAAKYMARFGDAMESKDWPGAYKALCRLMEIHHVEEMMDRGY